VLLLPPVVLAAAVEDEVGDVAVCGRLDAAVLFVVDCAQDEDVWWCWLL